MKINKGGLLSIPTHFLTLASAITPIYLACISQVDVSLIANKNQYFQCPQLPTFHFEMVSF